MRLTSTEQAIADLLAQHPDGLTMAEIAERCGSKSTQSVKVLIHRMRGKGVAITSPRHTSRRGPRKGVSQAYQLGGDA